MPFIISFIMPFIIKNFKFMRNIVKFVLIFLLILTGDINYIYAQHYNQEIDSLIALSSTLADYEKAGVCNDITWKLRNYRPEEAIKFSMEAIEAAQRSGNHQELIKAYSYIGVCHRNIGNYADALDYYSMGLDSARKYNSLDDIAYGYNNLGNAYVVLGNYQKACDNLVSALEYAERLGNKSIMAYAHLNLGRAYTGIKNFPAAEEHLNKALKIRREINVPKYKHIMVEKVNGEN